MINPTMVVNMLDEPWKKYERCDEPIVSPNERSAKVKEMESIEPYRGKAKKFLKIKK
jgi:hypothetical protein